MDLINAFVFRHCCTIDGQSLGWDGCSRDRGFLRFIFLSFFLFVSLQATEKHFRHFTDGRYPERLGGRRAFGCKALQGKQARQLNADFVEWKHISIFFFTVSAQMD